MGGRTQPFLGEQGCLRGYFQTMRRLSCAGRSAADITGFVTPCWFGRADITGFYLVTRFYNPVRSQARSSYQQVANWLRK